MTNPCGDKEDSVRDELKRFKQAIKKIYDVTQGTPTFEVVKDSGLPSHVVEALKKYEESICAIDALCGVLYP